MPMEGPQSRPPAPMPNRRTEWRRHEDRRLLQRERELEAARRICQALFQHIRVDELVEKVLRTALEVVGAEAGSVLLADPTTKQLVFCYLIGEKAGVLKGKSMPWDEGIAGAVFTSGAVEVVRDVKRDHRHYGAMDMLTGYDTRDMITLPLRRWEGDSIGVLQVLNKRVGRLDDDDVAILTIVSALSAAEIEQARLYEEAKLAQVGRLLGDVCHDVKNLLQPIITVEEWLKDELEEYFGVRSESKAGKIRTSQGQCNEMVAMVHDSTSRILDRMRGIADCVKRLSPPSPLVPLRASSETESVMPQPQFVSCCLANVIESVFRILHVFAENAGVSLQTEGLDALPTIVADEHRLFNAFYNLIMNAIPEVPAGGSVTVRGSFDPVASAVNVSVVDTGRGMSQEVCESLFTALVITQKLGGTGLGTKIVKDEVDAHGGQITVESKEGAGTAFHIRLPLVPPGLSAA